jgi:hypothetical protein
VSAYAVVKVLTCQKAQQKADALTGTQTGIKALTHNLHFYQSTGFDNTYQVVAGSLPRGLSAVNNPSRCIKNPPV